MSPEPRIYHGCPSLARLEELAERFPNVEHGAQWLPERYSWVSRPWFLDNGAYSGNFRPEAWRTVLDRTVENAPREPDWVVLPDVFQDWDATLARHLEYVEAVRSRDLEPAIVAQPPAGPEEIRDAAALLDASVVLVGGGTDYTYRGAGRQVLREVDELHLHVGEPGDCYIRPFELGADSVDTTATVRRQETDRLQRLDAWAAGEGYW